MTTHSDAQLATSDFGEETAGLFVSINVKVQGSLFPTIQETKQALLS